MRARGRETVRRLLRRILRDNKNGSLNGSLSQRTVACKRAADYIVILKTTPPAKQLPYTLRQLVSDLRYQARTGNARSRLNACEQLLLIEGVAVPYQDDATGCYICEQLAIEPPQVVAESNTQARWRAGVRRQALLDITECFNADRIHWASLDDVALRLPEQEAPAAPKASAISTELQARLNRLGGKL